MQPARLIVWFQGWVDEHRMRRKLGVKENSDNELDFMDVMISINDGRHYQIPRGYDADTVIKATCLVRTF